MTEHIAREDGCTCLHTWWDESYHELHQVGCPVTKPPAESTKTTKHPISESRLQEWERHLRTHGQMRSATCQELIDHVRSLTLVNDAQALQLSRNHNRRRKYVNARLVWRGHMRDLKARLDAYQDKADQWDAAQPMIEAMQGVVMAAQEAQRFSDNERHHQHAWEEREPGNCGDQAIALTNAILFREVADRILKSALGKIDELTGVIPQEAK